MDGDAEAILAWLNLNQAHAVLRAGLGRALETQAGVGISEIEVLRRLAFAPDERLRMRDLADQLFVAQSGITRIIDRLVRQGWVVREQPPDDRRTIYARLTDEGRSVVERAVPVYARTVAEQLGGDLSASDVAELRRVLRRVLEGLGAWDDERCDPQHVGAAGHEEGAGETVSTT
jgi:DNA-binding MarR family transcriptional regulator